MTNRKLPSTMLASAALAAKDQPVNPNTDAAGLITGSALAGLMIISAYAKSSVSEVEVLTKLRQQAQAIQQGDMSQVEAMLINQAVALQTMFVDLAVSGKKQTQLQAQQGLTQLALRAQAGSRATLQALAEVRNPRQVAFVRQTNVAQTQQVNNGSRPISRGRKLKNMPNELIVEVPHGRKKMDIRAKAAPGRADPAMGAVDAIDRSAKRGR